MERKKGIQLEKKEKGGRVEEVERFIDALQRNRLYVIKAAVL